MGQSALTFQPWEYGDPWTKSHQSSNSNGGLTMVREIMKDTTFLSQKAEPATLEDIKEMSGWIHQQTG